MFLFVHSQTASSSTECKPRAGGKLFFIFKLLYVSAAWLGWQIVKIADNRRDWHDLADWHSS
jgi:hypothetical protein